MKKTKHVTHTTTGMRWHKLALLGAMAGLGLAGALPVVAAEDTLPAVVEPAVAPWKVEVFYENDTHVRGKDNTGESVGLSKFRNTMQVEADKSLSGGWKFHGVLRGTFDGVYRLNKSQFGETAGSNSASDVRFENTAGPIARAVGAPLPPQYLTATVPFGGGVGFTVVDAIQAGAGLPNLGGPAGGPGINRFLDFYGPNNPGTGLRVLGDRWHDTKGGVSFAVPVRPCNVDKRGCVDFGGYGNKDQSELESPEFNKRFDFLREAYVTNSIPLSDGQQLFLKLGRQQVVWGRTDLFRVLDVINPVDYSRNNIYDELQDIRIPMWIAQAEYRMGPSDSMQDRNLQLIWNVDKFRANNLGQCGTANVILDAGCFFRGFKNMWDNGGTVANFAAFSAPGTPGPGTGPWFATNFGPHQVGIRNVNLPSWKLENTQLGAKYEGVTQGGLSFSVNALTYRSQLPSLRAFNAGETPSANSPINPFTGAIGNASPFSGPARGIPTTHLIAFDVYFPRVNLIGGSMDLQWQAAKAAVRLEAAVTSGEEFPNTLRPQLFSKNKVFRSVIGFDRPTFIPFINPNRTTLFSAQLFYQHIFNHEERQGLYGPVGMPDWKDNVIATLLVKAFLANDRVSPQVITAYDVKARALVVSPTIDWLFSDTLKLTFGGNFKTRDNDTRWKYDECRSCNPYAPYTTYVGQDFNPGSAGVGGIETLGRFRAGPIGTAWKENEVFVTLRYKF